MEVEGKLAAKPRIQKEFQAEFKGVHFRLNDARYEELVAMIPDPGTQVFDHVSDKVYFVGEEEKARPLLPPQDAPDKKVRAKDFVEPEAVEKANDAAAGPGEREHTPPLVSSRQEADMMLGKRVVVVGEARTGKTPNVRVTSDFYVVCHGDFRWQGALTKRVFDWPESFVGERVQVIGRIEKVYLGETNSVPIIESNYGYRLWDVVYEMAKPQPTRRHMTYQEILAGRAAPDLNRLAERSAPSEKDFIEPEFAAGTDHQPEDRAHSDWLARIVNQVETIKAGMSRRDVEKILFEDVAGFTNPKAMRYQHPACSYIKLDLEFELAASGDRKDDKITKRSDPLLDLIPNKAKW
jgi:hypothetical protein